MSAEEKVLDVGTSFACHRIGPKLSQLTLCNEGGVVVDEVALGERLSAIPGIDRIEFLSIAPDARVKNLQFLWAIPKLRRFVVSGKALETLDGIERYRGPGAKIDTRPHAKRDLGALARARLTELDLAWAGDHDTAVLARSRTLQVLVLRGAPFTAVGKLPGCATSPSAAETARRSTSARFASATSSSSTTAVRSGASRGRATSPGSISTGASSSSLRRWRACRA